ncbi:MAG TPA: HPF/RaiA family ribosome-associated protein [Puia sp.]|nr:HPF/RaiA family ribosome-associated protein [Puia sp.]
MQVQINSENNIKISQEQIAAFQGMISDALEHYSDRLMWAEAHLSDENGNKNGPNDKRCLLEVRPKGLQPVVASNTASTLEEAISGAADKLRQSLAGIKGRQENH